MKIIRQWIYKEVNKKVIVNAQYPDFQVDLFDYVIPFKEGLTENDVDYVGILVSTEHKDTLFYEYYSKEINKELFLSNNEIILKLKNNIEESISKHVQFIN
jgi:hypothetical protein